MKPITTIIVAVCAGLTLLFSVLLMPAAELLPAHFNPAESGPGESPVRSESAMKAYQAIGDSAFRMFTGGRSMEQVLKENPNFPYYMYSVAIALAMTAAAIGINAVGRYDSEEKTIIPVKK